MRVDLATACEALLRGQCVGVPTETVYGLGARAGDEGAVRQVFALKGRPSGHPLIVHVDGVEQASEVGVWDARAQALHDLWPGPLTLVLPNRAATDAVRGGHDTVAVRMPAHPAALGLIAQVGPIAAPSANRFGRVSPTTAAHVLAEFPGLPVLDGGACAVGVESTILALVGDVPRLLRPGAVSLELLIARLGPVEVGGLIAAPGTLPSHYATRARVRLVEAGQPADLGYDDPGIYAQRLYDRLRELDDGRATITCALAPARGIGVAVNDRLRRAAAERLDG